jgi:predicted nucleic acid-binding protein
MVDKEGTTRPSALLDTNLLIDYLCGRVEARSVLDESVDRAISIATWTEVMAGATSEDEAQLRAFLRSFRIVPITEEVAERAVALRRLFRLKLPDAIILATAQTEKRLLLTRNARDFPADGAGIEVPYTL